MKKFKSNRELVEKIFDGLREILKMTIFIRGKILNDEFDVLPEYLARREEKIKEVEEFLKELGKLKCEIPNFQQILKEIEIMRDEILKIDTENADNIKERMKEVSDELQELIRRKKLLNYLR
jgi:uncharacterized protein Yka (UPF0111/DUF47 family)